MSVRSLAAALFGALLLLSSPSSALAVSAAHARHLPASSPLGGPTDRVPLERRAASFATTGLPVSLIGSASLVGSVFDAGGTGVSGAEVGWSVPVSGSYDTGTTTTDSAGTYALAGVTPAGGNGSIWASWAWSGWGPYLLGRTAATWPDSTSTTVDLRARSITLETFMDGAWSKEGPDTVWLYGHDGVSSLVSSSGVAFNGRIDNYPLTLPGVTDTAAIYFWSNEGVEVDTAISTVDHSVLDGFYRTPYDTVFAVAAVDADTAWVEKGNGLFRTTDAGLTWSQSAGAGSSNDIAFTDAATGWLVGEYRIGATTDGGATWVDQTPKVTAPLMGVDAIDGQHVWVVGGGGHTSATTDGGSTWTPHPSGATATLQSVDFVDTGHGWAVGDKGTIVSTADGGVTWKKRPSGTTLTLYSVQFVDTLRGWAVGGGWAPKRSVLLATTDGGATWTKRSAGTGQPLMGVDATDAQHVWLVGDNGTIRATTDGGVHWLRQSPAVTSTVGNGLWCMDMLDAQHGWAGGEMNTVLATADGGSQWRREFNLNMRQRHAQRFWVDSPHWASGAPGTRARLVLQQFGRGFVSELSGYSAYPDTAPVKTLGTATSSGARNQTKTVTIPAGATPGYVYVVGLQHAGGVLYLESPFQVATLKPSSGRVRRGTSVRLSGIVPTQGHVGSQAGRTKKLLVFARTTPAGQPGAGDPTKKGWKLVSTCKASGLGKYTTPRLRPTRSTWYVVYYPGDDWYWGAFTSVVKVTVR